MKKLLVFLKNYKKECVLAPLFKMLEASFELIVPLVVSAIIDVGIVHRDKNYILQMCLVMVALGLIGLVCSVTAQYFAAKAAAGFGTACSGRFQGRSAAPPAPTGIFPGGDTGCPPACLGLDGRCSR